MGKNKSETFALKKGVQEIEQLQFVEIVIGLDQLVCVCTFTELMLGLVITKKELKLFQKLEHNLKANCKL
jgi:hypothetical protein